MIQVFLNRPEVPDSPAMSRALLVRVLKLVARDPIARVNLIADWSRPPEDFPWALHQMKVDRVRCTISFRPHDPRGPIELAAQSGCNLALHLGGRGVRPLPRWLNDLPLAEVFIPVESPGVELSAFVPAIDGLASTGRIVLGVGWRDWLSGPLPLSRARKTDLAAAAVDLIRESTERERTVGLACGMELCLFSRKQLSTLATKRIRWPIGFCPTPLIIQPDGRIDACQRIHLPAPVFLDDDIGPEDLSRQCLEWLRPVRGLCNLEMTADCASFTTRACAGGCLDHYLADWQSAKGTAFTGHCRSPL